MNHGKKSIALDVKNPEHIVWLKNYLSEADVFVQNMRPGLLDELGLGSAEMCALNPRLVYCSLTAFGHKGPKKLDPGYEPMIQAFAGLFSVNGDANGPTSRVGMQVLDLGTGTGRMVSLLGTQAQRIVGVDASHAMLAVARANLEHESIKGVEWRQGDLYALPVDRNAFELVMIHQVLHFLDDPARALREAAQALAPGGRLVVIDFAPHDLEFLRETQAHRRLGFSVGQMTDWLIEAGLDVTQHEEIAPPNAAGGQLTVSIFVACDPRHLLA
jgi:SAM-dependent methyltransferase